MTYTIENIFPEKPKDKISRQLLEECLQRPTDKALCENTSNNCIINKQYDNARALWRFVLKKNPSSSDPSFWLLYIDILQTGFSTVKFNEMVDIASETKGKENLWSILFDIDEEFNSGCNKTLLKKKVPGDFSGHPSCGTHHADESSILKKIWRLSFTQSILRKFLSLYAVRKILQEYDRQSISATANNISELLGSAYRKGSVLAEFPRSPERQSPENYDEYMRTGPDPWWPWIKEHTPVKDATGLKLIDVGSGPGFNGQHFQYIGYEVTAQSGNYLELAECARRGMQTIQSEMHNIPVPNNSYDAAFACHVLEHSVIPYVLLLEIKRILKPGGLLFVNLPYPIEGDPALDYPECYDAEKDEYRFEVDEKTGHFKHLELAYYSYSFEHHIFVLTYWQWRWLFKNVGFEHIASTIEVIGSGEFLPGESIARNQEYIRRPKNQHFILKRV